jgi:hypothetical protein
MESSMGKQSQTPVIGDEVLNEKVIVNKLGDCNCPP